MTTTPITDKHDEEVCGLGGFFNAVPSKVARSLELDVEKWKDAARGAMVDRYDALTENEELRFKINMLSAALRAMTPVVRTPQRPGQSGNTSSDGCTQAAAESNCEACDGKG